MARTTRTRLDLKRQRERLARFRRFLPALKLRQQQLQLALQGVERQLAKAREGLARARARFAAYSAVLSDYAGVDVVALAEPAEVRLATVNIAGVAVPVLQEVSFQEATYSLFGTPPWVDRALQDLRQVNRERTEVEILERQRTLLRSELTRVVQRVNLFEKVKIPEAERLVRLIRVHLGDEMAAAVGRAKIAKGRLTNEAGSGGGS